MSLVGNLEDLGLGDILQIVSLSRKSGVLTLKNRGREGRIAFLQGQVIQATSSVFRENLGDLLLRKGLVDLDTLKKALHLQQLTPRPVRLGAILSENFGLSRVVIENILREQIEKTVYSFFGWTEGTFSFVLGNPDDLAATNLDPLQFMLDQGLNPHWLAAEGIRHSGGVDPQRMEGGKAACQENNSGGDSPSVDDGPAGPGRGAVLLIDDDAPVLERVGRALEDRGFRSHLFSCADSFLKAAVKMTEQGRDPLLVIDLIMPRADGNGMLGGLDLLDRIRTLLPQARFLMMTDLPSPEAERKLLREGVAGLLIKPRVREIEGESGAQTLEALVQSICRFEIERRKGSPLFNLGAELCQEIGEEPVWSDSGRADSSPGLHLLKGMLQELGNPSLGGGIILLVLRFASEFMNRGVIFLVKKDQIVGLGQFGIDLPGGKADAQVRSMRIPTAEASLFSAVLRGQMPMRTRPGDGPWDTYLQEVLGGEKPLDVFVGPILSEGKTVALLYGDNLPEQKPIGGTEPLEIFLSQAGMAMEKALLEQRLQEKMPFSGGERDACGKKF